MYICELISTTYNVYKLWQQHMYILYIPDGIPNDGIPIEEVVTVSLALTVVYVILAVTGLLFAVGCLLFNLLYREKV